MGQRADVQGCRIKMRGRRGVDVRDGTGVDRCRIVLEVRNTGVLEHAVELEQRARVVEHDGMIGRRGLQRSQIGQRAGVGV
jgi:hypothetical protein